MTHLFRAEALDRLRRLFHKTRLTDNMSVPPEIADGILYGAEPAASSAYPLPALLAERATQIDPDGVLGSYFFALELAGEAGEAANTVKKLWREALGVGGSRATPEQVADELADVVITAGNLARVMGIDLFGEAIPRVFDATSDKFGVETKWRSNP